MIATHSCKEAIWIMKLCLKLGLSQRAIIVECDSNNAIFLGKNLNFHANKKHIDK
jgi:hypothetical protein